MDWLDLLAVQGTLKSLLQHYSSKASIFQHSAFFIVQLSHPYMTTGKTIALTRRTFVDKVISLLCNMLSRLGITFLPRSKCLLISWLQSPSICSDFGAQKNKVSHCFHCFLIYLPWSDGTGCHDRKKVGEILLATPLELIFILYLLCPFLAIHFCMSLTKSKNTKLTCGLPRWSSGEESACNAGDVVLIPESGRSPGKGNGNPLQYSCWENPMEPGALQSIGSQKSWTWLSNLAHVHTPGARQPRIWIL